MRWVIVLVFLGLLIPTTPLSAQTQLSEEEEALLDRLFAAVDKADTYDSFTATTTEFYIVEMQFSILDKTAEFLKSVTSNSDGYVVRSDDSERSSSTVTVAYVSRSPQDNTRYTIGADVVTVDDILYVNAAYTELGNTALPPIEPNWHVYRSADEIPNVLHELRLDEVFSSDETTIFDREALRTTASEVTVESGELSDGTPVEVIRVLVVEDLASYLDLGDDVLGQILTQAELEGEIIFTASLDRDDNVLMTNFSIMVSISELDLGELELEMFPQGTSFDLTVDTTQIGTISNINADYEDIQVPIE
jgi:hypothetical protein